MAVANVAISLAVRRLRRVADVAKPMVVGASAKSLDAAASLDEKASV